MKTLKIRNLSDWEAEKIRKRIEALIGKPRADKDVVVSDEETELEDVIA